jgi:carbamoyltransferase
LYSELASYLFAGHDSEGKLMALSAYGRESLDFPYSFFEIYEDRVYLKLNNLLRESRNRPVGMPDDMPHFEAELNWEALPPSPIQCGEITQFHRNLTYQIQKDLEEALLYLAYELRKITASPNLCISGGVALNCVANARILEEAGFENVFICPAPGDSGQSLGAALEIWYSNHPPLKERLLFNHTGREYHNQKILSTLRNAGDKITFHHYDKITFHHYDNIAYETAQRLAKGEIVAWFQGRSEFGPRALGARSILADPRSKEIIRRLNDEIKTRRWFQPVAPSILAERVLEYFTVADSPFMSFAVNARENTKRLAPGIVHNDGTSRIHTVEAAENPIYHRLICEFEKLSGIPIVANTSFNAKGEPIVESPQDALGALYRMPFDSLAIGPFMVMRARNIIS